MTAARKLVFNSTKQDILKAIPLPVCDPTEYKDNLAYEFIVPNAIPVCTRCSETTHTKSKCMKFRTVVCIQCQKGLCTFDPCFYAKDKESIRTPKADICIRVRIIVFETKGKQWKRVQVYGCGSRLHRFKKCHNK
jgi:hypothetical protein